MQVPDLPALAEVGDVLSAELGYQSLGEQLGRLTPLLKDESTEVSTPLKVGPISFGRICGARYEGMIGF